MNFQESEKLELKSSLSGWKEAIITLCAFANKKGGKVIIGLDDNGQPLGKVFGKGAIEDFANKIKNNTDPILYPSINVQTFGLGDIVEIIIEESDNKPVFAFGRAYIRVGKTTQKLSTTEVREMIKRYTLPDIDEQIIDSQRGSYKEFNKILWGKLKKKLSVLNKKEDKIAYGLYLCFVEKNTEFHNAIIKAARFKGVTSVEFIDEKQFDCPLLSMPKEIMAFIRRHINKQIVISGKAEHDEVWEYPLEALREAIMNAIVHRDYADSGNTQIRIFDDRIEVWSPGLLPKEINIAEIYKEARSVPRNKLIMRIFHECGLIENWGTGFQRMLALCRANNNPDPEFSNRSGAFVISFQKRDNSINKLGDKLGDKLGEKLGENQRMILKSMKENKNVTIPELSEKVKISTTAIENNIAKLKQKGILERIGPDKGGYWKIKQ